MRGVIVLAFLLAWVSCGDGSPSGPEPPPPSPGSNYATFTNPATGFSTTDVRDVDEQIMRFDLDQNALIWLPDSLAFDGWVVDGNFLGVGRPYQVRFGRVDGQERAYFTETGRGTICDLEVDSAGFLSIQPTNRLPPG